MKIFVTVGSTHFNSLIQQVDQLLNCDDFDVTCQIADGSYIPKNHKYIRMTDVIEQYFAEADVVITHAGAGTVFYLLESVKKMVVVPNCERVDNHQLDLAQYVEKNMFAKVCYQLTDLPSCIHSVNTTEYSPYINQPFDGFSLIEHLFNSSTASEIAEIPLNIFEDMDDAVDHIILDGNNVLAGSAIAINPEKIMRAQNDCETKNAIMAASIRYADGIGVVKTLARKTGKKVSRIPGCELWEEIMLKAGKSDIPVFLLGASPDVSLMTVDKLKQQYQVNLCGVQDGYFDKDSENKLIEEIAASKAKIVTVALGSPRQELFIKKCQKVHPNAFYMGVGGTYDVYTEQVKRAPEIYRKLNLEWFYRLMSDPRRIFRQTNLIKYLYLDVTRQL